MTQSAQSVQERINLSLLNDRNISLDIIADNSHLPWNSIALSLHSKLTQQFVDDHPELPWNQEILKVTLSSKIHLESSINNKPTVPLTKLTTEPFRCGELIITARMYVVNDSQGIVLIGFDNEYYYLCQLDIDGNNPSIIPDNKRTLELTQFSTVYNQQLINSLVNQLDKRTWQSAWNHNDSVIKLRMAIQKILERGQCLDIQEYKRYILGKIQLLSGNVYLEVVRWLCISKYPTEDNIRSIMELILNPDHRIDSLDLCIVLLTIVDNDCSLEKKLELINQFIELYEDENDELVTRLTTSIKEVIEGWNEFDIPSKYRVIEMIIKMNCSVIMERYNY